MHACVNLNNVPVLNINSGYSDILKHHIITNNMEYVKFLEKTKIKL